MFSGAPGRREIPESPAPLEVRLLSLHARYRAARVAGRSRIAETPDWLREAARLTDYAVEARYPGVAEPVEKEEYDEVIALAEKVIVWVEDKLKDEDVSSGDDP